MSLDAIIMALGALVIIVPQLGLPSSWQTGLLIIAGVFVVICGIVVRRGGITNMLPRKNPRSKRAPVSSASSQSPPESEHHDSI
jgi:hypothetical protein